MLSALYHVTKTNTQPGGFAEAPSIMDQLFERENFEERNIGVQCVIGWNLPLVLWRKYAYPMIHSAVYILMR